MPHHGVVQRIQRLRCMRASKHFFSIVQTMPDLRVAYHAPDGFCGLREREMAGSSGVSGFK